MNVNQSSHLISGAPALLIKLKVGIAMFWISFKTFRNPFQALNALVMLAGQRKRLHGYKKDHKIVRSNRKYYWSIYMPGFPSENFNAFIRREITKAYSGNNNENNEASLQTLILSVSSICHYHCEHCFEGEHLNTSEHLSFEDLSRLINDAIQLNVRHLQLSGGEPMIRFEDMTRLTRQAGGAMDFWISTSGYGFTRENAVILKESGITGATISLDHWEEQSHDKFRQYPGAYKQALKAIDHCNEAGIITNLTLCVTREMANKHDLMKYLELARTKNVKFVRFLEARKVGNYADKDVLLRKQEQEYLLSFYLMMNSRKRYKAYPIIQYPGFHQRKLGCFGAGNRYLHIDAKGDYHGCPFCRGSVGNIKHMSLHEATLKLREKGCQLFKTNDHV